MLGVRGHSGERAARVCALADALLRFFHRHRPRPRREDAQVVAASGERADFVGLLPVARDAGVASELVLHA